jgi:hypothetical protein
MQKWTRSLSNIFFGHHLLVSLGIVVLVAWVISSQITNRFSFANSELYQDVIDRWGSPIVQPVPSVRYVASGSIFNKLHALPLDKQNIVVDAMMNYRKRGLVYFSGFDFSFLGQYGIKNPFKHAIDVVFVFPINMPKNQVLLSDFSFLVNGKPAAADLLINEADKLVWTGRLEPGQNLNYDISFKGRGLDSFTYQLDPKLRVNDFRFVFNVKGGRSHDYQQGVAPADSIVTDDDSLSLTWQFASLESGVPVGLILPSEQSYDDILSTMVRRSWAPFIFFFLGIICIGLVRRRNLRFYEAYLIAAGYALFYVLVAYLAAFFDFYLAYVSALLLIATLLYYYLRLIISNQAAQYGLGLVASFLFVPSLAVILQGYTGLIYTLEITAAIAALMVLTSRPLFRNLIEQIVGSVSQTGESYAI